MLLVYFCHDLAAKLSQTVTASKSVRYRAPDRFSFSRNAAVGVIMRPPTSKHHVGTSAKIRRRLLPPSSCCILLTAQSLLASKTLPLFFRHFLSSKPQHLSRKAR